MEDNNYSTKSKMYNLFVKHLDGKTLTLLFPSPILYANSIKDRLFEVTGIPPQHQRLVTGCRHLNDDDDKSVIRCSPEDNNIFPTVRLLLRLKGGKGGFGSLLRGAATKAGQKKTNNFDACRDMSGRRLRHVNAEKRLEEWKAGEEERRLEKVAEEFLKKQMKKGKKGVGDGEAHKYVAKYREESERCVADVAQSVKEALMSVSGKRKGSEVRVKAKKLKIWMGKRKLNESDSDDTDKEEGDDEGENEKSILLNSQNESDSVKAEGSSGSVTGPKQDGESSGAGSCESGSEEEKETLTEDKMESVPCLSTETIQAQLNVTVEPVMHEETTKVTTMPCSESVISAMNDEDNEYQDCNGAVSDKFDVAACQVLNIMSSESVAGATELNDMEIDGSLDHKASVHEETSASPSVPALDEPLNFDNFDSAAELEVLGMERLKSELQSRGLKCGGTLQERAGRLFLLKSTTLDKIPKKLLAKK